MTSTITNQYQENAENCSTQDSTVKTNVSKELWESPKEFSGEPTKKFKLEWMPECCQEFASAQVDYYKVDKAFPCSVMLYTSGIATQPHDFEVRMGWKVPLFIDMLIVAKAGEHKSTMKRENVRPIDDFVNDYNKKHKDEFSKSQQKAKYMEKRLQKLQADAVKDESLYEEVEKLALEISRFEKKVPLKLYTSDVTPERIANLLAEQNGMMNAISPEGSFLSNIAGKYCGGEASADSVLKGFDCDSIEVDRMNRVGETIQNPRFSFLQLIQPVVYDKLASNSILCGQGLLGRCLLCCPESAGGRFDFFADAIPEKTRVDYDNLIIRLMQMRDKPKMLKMSHDGYQLFGEWANYFNKEIFPKDFRDFDDAGSKFVGIIARVCGILQLMFNPNADIVEADVVRRAIEMSEYYQEQILLIRNGHILNVEQSLARYLLGRIRECHKKGRTKIVGGELTLSFRDLTRACHKNELAKKDDFIEPLKILQGMGYVDFIEPLKAVTINPKGV